MAYTSEQQCAFKCTGGCVPNTTTRHGRELARDDEHDELADTEHLDVDGVRRPSVGPIRVALRIAIVRMSQAMRPIVEVRAYRIQQNRLGSLTFDLLRWWQRRHDT